MRTGSAFWLGMAFLLFVAGRSRAQEDVRVEVTVTYVSGASVYLDRGREDGLEIGDLVWFEIPGVGRVEAELVVVSASTSRAVLPEGRAVPEPGVSGEIRIPASRRTPEDFSPRPRPGPDPDRPVPDHPPWEREVEPAGEDEPLLAPALSKPAWERPLAVRGRFRAYWLSNVDREGDRDAKFSLYRFGGGVIFENLFGRGGVLEIDADAEQRKRDIDGFDSETDNRVRINRLFYLWGRGIDSPTQFRVGRFLPRDWPELGLIDGVEGTFDVGDIGRIGVDLGAFPEPLPDRDSFKDLGASLSFVTTSEERSTPTLGVALHQTWHEGDRDRSLFLGKIDWHPTREVDLRGIAWLDFYGSEDEIKDGVELTELSLSGRWRYHRDHSASVHLNYIRWPELLRDEFRDIRAEFIEDNKVTRVQLRSDHRLSEHLRLGGRIGFWSDQDDDGVTGDLNVRTPDLLLPGNEIALRIFRIDGAFGDGAGARVTMRQDVGDVSFSLSYEHVEQKRDSFDRGTADITGQAVLATIDFYPSRNWSISISGDWRFGDAQDSMGIGVFLTYRF